MFNTYVVSLNTGDMYSCSPVLEDMFVSLNGPLADLHMLQARVIF